jgi:hypothetical protein
LAVTAAGVDQEFFESFREDLIVWLAFLSSAFEQAGEEREFAE